MAEFTAITTQEQFDQAVKDRLTRERESSAKKYEGYTSPADLEKIRADYDKQIADLTNAAEANAKKYAKYDQDIADRDAKIKGYETASLKTRVALEEGLGYELSARLKGESEDDIRADAKELAKLIGSQKKPTAPVFKSDKDGEVSSADPTVAAFRQLSGKLVNK